MRSLAMHLLALCLAMLTGLAACRGPQQEPLALRVTPDSPDARLAVAVDGGLATVDVFSESGIGGAEVEVTSRKLPDRLLLRFHLAGLEGLELACGDVAVSASLLSHSGNPIHESVPIVGGEAQDIAPGNPYWLRIDVVPEGEAAKTIPLEKGYIEVEVPQALIQACRGRFSLRWADFYR